MHKDDHRKDGAFELYYDDGFARLVVYPPENGGLPVYREEILSRMKILGIPRVRVQRIIEIIGEASSLPVKLIEWSEGAVLSSHLQLKIGEDGMSVEALITAPKPGGGEIGLRDIYDELEKAGIRFGIDEREIGRILSERLFGSAFIIASGRIAVDGRESIIRYNFETERHKPFMELQYGRINLKELNFIQNCSEGDILAELVPAEEAVDGYDVFGNRFIAVPPGTAAVLKCGANTEIEGNKIISKIRGNVVLNSGTVEVEEIVSVENVDYETGNIDFDGSVDISGTIADGFSVKASGDVQVGKCIGRCSVSAGRDVILKAGINGDREGRIEAAGNILSRYLESCSISCDGDVLVEEVVMNSQIDTAGSLLLTGRRAELIGGFSIIGKTLICRKIGNLYDSKTGVIMGVHPPVIESFFNLKKALDTSRERLDKLDEQKLQLKALKPADREGAVKILQALEKVEEDIARTAEDISRRIREMQEKREEIVPDRKSYILVEDRLYKGVRLSFGLTDHPVPEMGISSSYIYMKGREIVEKGFNRAKPELPEELL